MRGTFRLSMPPRLEATTRDLTNPIQSSSATASGEMQLDGSGSQRQDFRNLRRTLPRRLRLNQSTQQQNQPTSQPTQQSSTEPSLQPSKHPSVQTSTAPLVQLSRSPSIQPSAIPTNQPSCSPTSYPSMLLSTTLFSPLIWNRSGLVNWELHNKTRKGGRGSTISVASDWVTSGSTINSPTFNATIRLSL